MIDILKLKKGLRNCNSDSLKYKEIQKQITEIELSNKKEVELKKKKKEKVQDIVNLSPNID